MKRTLLLALFLILPLSTNASSGPATKTAAVQAVALDELEENCQAIKQIAAATIDLRYTGAKLYEILAARDKTFKNKEDADYKKIFTFILQDAFNQSMYKEAINIKAESKKFANKHYFLCSASYKGF